MTRQMDQRRILIQNVPDGYQVTLDSQEAVSIRLRGLQANLNAIDVSQLSGTIDVSDWMQENGLTELTEGEMEMEVAVALPDECDADRYSDRSGEGPCRYHRKSWNSRKAAAAGTPESAAAGAAESAAAGTAAPAIRLRIEADMAAYNGPAFDYDAGKERKDG